MPAIEEKLFSNWLRGWSPLSNPLGGIVYPRDASENQLMDCYGLEVDPSGVLRQRRNQLRIEPPEVADDITGLWEFRNQTYNQVLFLTDAGDLYVLDTLWTAMVLSQWDYGYNAFEDNWVLVESGLPPVMSAIPWNDKLLFIAVDYPMLMWDGAALVEVGLAAPDTPPVVGGGTTQDLTTWIETDAGALLAVAVLNATVTAADDANVVRLYLDVSADPIGNFQHKFQINVDSLTDGPPDSLMRFWGVQQATDEDRKDWDEPFFELLGITVSGGTYDLQLVSGSHVLAYSDLPLDDDTDYYVTITRNGVSLRCDLYDDAARTNLIWSSGNCLVSSAPMNCIYLVYTYGAGATFTGDYTYTISNVDLGVAIVAGPLAEGTYSYRVTFYNDNYESMPSDIVDVVVANDSGIPITDIPVGPAGVVGRRIYRAYTPDTSLNARGSEFGLLHDIEDNTTQEYLDTTAQIYVQEGQAFDHALPPRAGLGAYHGDRVFLAGSFEGSRSYEGYEEGDFGNALFYSYIGEHAYFPGANVIYVGGYAPIVGLLDLHTELLIFKTDSVWSLTGYGEDDFTLARVTDKTGMVAGNACAAGAGGACFGGPDGYWFYSANGLRKLFPAGGEWALPAALPGYVTPSVAYHLGRFYIAQEDVLIRWEPERDAWWYGPPVSVPIGLQAISLGEEQSHLLCMMAWETETALEITVLDLLDSPAESSAEGSVYTSLFAPVRVTFPVIIAPPGEELIPSSVVVEGDWDTTGDVYDSLYLYVNDDAAYDGEVGDNAWAWVPTILPDSGVHGIPHGYVSGAVERTNGLRMIYVQIVAEYMPGFELDAMRLRFWRRRCARAGTPSVPPP